MPSLLVRVILRNTQSWGAKLYTRRVTLSEDSVSSPSWVIAREFHSFPLLLQDISTALGRAAE